MSLDLQDRSFFKWYRPSGTGIRIRNYQASATHYPIAMIDLLRLGDAVGWAGKATTLKTKGDTRRRHLVRCIVMELKRKDVCEAREDKKDKEEALEREIPAV